MAAEAGGNFQVVCRLLARNLDHDSVFRVGAGRLLHHPATARGNAKPRMGLGRARVVGESRATMPDRGHSSLLADHPQRPRVRDEIRPTRPGQRQWNFHFPQPAL